MTRIVPETLPGRLRWNDSHPARFPIIAKVELNQKDSEMKKRIMKFGLLTGTIALIGLAGCATVEEQVAEVIAETRRTNLTGDQIVGGGGDRDGSAQAELTISDELNQVCYDVNGISNIGPVSSITINRATRGSNGPVVLRLTKPNEGGWKNCVGRAELIEDRMEGDPSAYYIIITTSDYPNGAIRGQFSRN
jgi:CHRD domain